MITRWWSRLGSLHIRLTQRTAAVPRRWRVAAAALVAVVLPAGIVVAGMNQGFPATRPYVLPAAAWLTSRAVGSVALVDGVSAEVAETVPVPSAGSGFTVVQQGPSGYVVDPAGPVTRVDGATHQIRPLPALPGGSGAPQVFAGTAGVFLVDGKRQLVRSIDPRTLASRDEWRVPAEVRAAATGDGGDLWVLDGDGAVIRFRSGAAPSRVRLKIGPVDASRPPQLAVTGLGPVVVDPASGRLHLLSPDGTEVAAAMPVDVRPGDLASADPSGSWLLVVRPADATLVRCDLAARSCLDPLPLVPGGTGGDPDRSDGALGASRSPAMAGPMGTAVVVDRHGFVPDYGAGVARIVDLDNGKTMPTAPVAVAGVRFELVGAGGVVFANDPDGPDAAVIAADGTVRRVAKYRAPRPTAAPATPTPSTGPPDPTARPRPIRSTPEQTPETSGPAPSRSTRPRPTPTHQGGHPTPTRTSTTGTPGNPYLPRHDRLVLDDRTADDWGRWGDPNEDGECRYAPDGYHVAANAYYHACYRDLELEEFTYEVEFALHTARAAGAFFRQSGDGHWYWVRLGRSGKVVIGVGLGGDGSNDRELKTWTVSPPKPDRWYRLAVTGVGTSLTVYVNGKRVGTATDRQYERGPIGVFMDGGQAPEVEGGEAVFRRARVWMP